MFRLLDLVFFTSLHRFQHADFVLGAEQRQFLGVMFFQRRKRSWPKALISRAQLRRLLHHHIEAVDGAGR